MKLLWCAVVLVVAGCAAHSGVVPAGLDTYLVSRQAGSGFAGSGTLKADALREAHQHCVSQQKVLTVLKTTEAQPPYIFGNFPKADVEFMCLAADDPRLADKEEQR
jgi:hypothetical protein